MSKSSDTHRTPIISEGAGYIQYETSSIIHFNSILNIIDIYQNNKNHNKIFPKKVFLNPEVYTPFNGKEFYAT